MPRYIECHIQFNEDEPQAIRQLGKALAEGGDVTPEVMDKIFTMLEEGFRPRLTHPTYISDDAEVGDVVLVPYGRYTHAALVTGEVADGEIDPNVSYRPIISILMTPADYR